MISQDLLELADHLALESRALVLVRRLRGHENDSYSIDQCSRYCLLSLENVLVQLTFFRDWSVLSFIFPPPRLRPVYFPETLAARVAFWPGVSLPVLYCVRSRPWRGSKPLVPSSFGTLSWSPAVPLVPFDVYCPDDSP